VERRKEIADETKRLLRVRTPRPAVGADQLGYPRCNATRKDGRPCAARATKDGFCVGHSPGAAEARRKGGRNSATSIRMERRIPRRYASVLELLEATIYKVDRDEIPREKGDTIARLAGAMARVTDVALFEDRITRLEKRLEEERVR